MGLKKFIGSALAVVSFFSFSTVCFANPWIDMNITYDYQTHRYNAEEVYLNVNGNRIENLSMPPIIFNGTALVPAREVFEPLGAVVDWKKDQEEVLIAYKDNIISIGINDKFVNVNGKEVSVSVPAKIINNKTMIPTRFIAESLGLYVNWDSNTRIITISEPKSVSNVETTTEINSEKSSEVTSESQNQNGSEQGKTATFNSVLCNDGKVIVTADGVFGDYSQPGSSNKSVVAFDVTNSVSSLDSEYKFEDTYFKKLTVMPIKTENSNIVRLVFEMNGEYSCSAQISEDGKQFTVIAGTEKTSSNSDASNVNSSVDAPNLAFNSYFGVDSASGKIFIKKLNSNFNLSAVSHNDNYSKLLYSLDLGCDLSDSAPDGKYSIGNGSLDNVFVQTVSGKTKFTFSEKNVYCFNVEEDSENIYITPISPKTVYSKIVVIDAGHGDDDPGAQANGIDEKDLNLDIALKLVDLLEKEPGIKVYATRLDDTFYTRPERSAFANNLGDLFISIHANSFTGESANGTEVWYYPHSNDYSIGLTCQKTAEVFQKNLIKYLGSTDRGVKSTDYDVLVLTKIPAVLCETGFITNLNEAAKLKTETYKQAAAQAMYDSVIELFSSYNPPR